MVTDFLLSSKEYPMASPKKLLTLSPSRSAHREILGNILLPSDSRYFFIKVESVVFPEPDNPSSQNTGVIRFSPLQGLPYEIHCDAFPNKIAGLTQKSALGPL